MNKTEIDKLKDIELEILIYIDGICKKNQIKYYLIGGTLLGAVRHKGFIPWDDDIDIVMLREDYNKLIDLLKIENNPKYFVQNFQTDPEYPRYITKIRANGTQFLEECVKDFNMHHGIFIDIFPLDKIKDKNEKKLDLRTYFANKILGIRRIRNGNFSKKSKYKRSIAKILRPFFLIIPMNFYNNLIDYIYGYENKYDCKYITNFSSQYGWRKQTFPIDVYGEGDYLEFEGHLFMVPSKWKVILESIYGDYMKLPPEEKRNSGHNVINIDLGKYA